MRRYPASVHFQSFGSLYSVVEDLPVVRTTRSAFLQLDLRVVECEFSLGNAIKGSCLLASCDAMRQPMAVVFDFAAVSGSVLCVAEPTRLSSNILVVDCHLGELDVENTALHLVLLSALAWPSSIRALVATRPELHR